MSGRREVEERIALLGTGKMGEAIISGLLRSEWKRPDQIVATARRPERASEVEKKFGVRTTLNNREAASSCLILILAVKPQDMEGLLTEIASAVGPRHTVISVAAGIPTRFIEARLGEVPVVRVMSNIPVVVDEAMSVISAGRHARDEHLETAEKILSHVGRVLRLPEKHLDAVTALSGSGPAYFALLAEAMIDAGILLGLSRDVAADLVIQTMLGSARMLRDTGLHPVEMRELVTSPGGTTIAAIRELEKARVRAAFLDAIWAAAERARELAAGRE